MSTCPPATDTRREGFRAAATRAQERGERISFHVERALQVPPCRGVCVATWPARYGRGERRLEDAFAVMSRLGRFFGLSLPRRGRRTTAHFLVQSRHRMHVSSRPTTMLQTRNGTDAPPPGTCGVRAAQRPEHGLGTGGGNTRATPCSDEARGAGEGPRQTSAHAGAWCARLGLAWGWCWDGCMRTRTRQPTQC